MPRPKTEKYCKKYKVFSQYEKYQDPGHVVSPEEGEHLKQIARQAEIMIHELDDKYNEICEEYEELRADYCDLEEEFELIPSDTEAAMKKIKEEFATATPAIGNHVALKLINYVKDQVVNPIRKKLDEDHKLKEAQTLAKATKHDQFTQTDAQSEDVVVAETPTAASKHNMQNATTNDINDDDTTAVIIVAEKLNNVKTSLSSKSINKATRKFFSDTEPSLPANASGVVAVRKIKRQLDKPSFLIPLNLGNPTKRKFKTLKAPLGTPTTSTITPTPSTSGFESSLNNTKEEDGNAEVKSSSTQMEPNASNEIIEDVIKPTESMKHSQRGRLILPRRRKYCSDSESNEEGSKDEVLPKKRIKRSFRELSKKL